MLAAWGLGLGAHLGSAAMLGHALCAWLLTVVAAAWCDRRGLRGPAESLLRRLLYRGVDLPPTSPDGPAASARPSTR